MFRITKTVRLLSAGDEENIRIRGQLPDDLGTAYEVPNPENVLAVEQHSVCHNGLPSSRHTPLQPTSKGPQGLENGTKDWAREALRPTAKKAWVAGPNQDGISAANFCDGL